MESEKIVDLIKQIDDESESLSSEIKRHKNDFSNHEYHDAYPKRLKTLKDIRILINFPTSSKDKAYILRAASILLDKNAEGLDRFAATKKIMQLADKYNIYNKKKPVDSFAEEVEEVKPRRK